MVYGNNYNRVNYNYTTKRTYPKAQRNIVPKAVLMKTGLKPFNIARTVNTAQPKSIVFSAKPMSFNTARPKAVKTARPNSAVVNAVRVNQANAIKASACWVWRPTKPDSASITLKKHNYIDARGRSNGCSRHMTRNIAYLSDFKEFDGGYVTFGGGAHGGRISGKGTLKTDSLDFEDVYFVNELKFNLFSVSQMCDKKNYVLFTDTECLVLSPNFKLPDESQILLKIPRKDNMYSFDMKNIVPKESLTCLVAKATLDESMLWHRRLGHINFKNINKLVKDNLVRGLPTKRKIPQSSGPPEKALIDKKKVIIMETSIRSDLHLEDAGVFINQQLGDMSHHKKIYVNPSHTKKIFANMKREGKDFSRRITPLFATMMKQSQRKQRKDTAITQEQTQQDDSVPTPSNDPPLSGEDSMQLSELMLLCTNLQKQVLDLEKAKDAQAKEIAWI
ncbi:ribonuclease H-like domain-containing protein [Tanacetum coccineum]